MAIYTKTGDTGQTALFGGKRISKAHPQVASYGSIDELTSYLGLVIAKISDSEEKELWISVQKALYQMMAVLAGAKTPITVVEKDIDIFEQHIDKLDKELPRLTRFILPGGTEMAGWFHILRTVCRRAERDTVAFYESEEDHAIPPETERIMQKYLNRLSDLFFMYARKYAEGKEIVT